MEMVSKIIVFLLIIVALVVITMLNKSNKKVKKTNNRKTKGEANKIKNQGAKRYLIPTKPL